MLLDIPREVALVGEQIKPRRRAFGGHRQFVADLPADENAKALAAGIVGLAHALGLQVIAAGVETEAQRDFLAALGCDFVQGYLTGKPVDADTASAAYV